MCKKLHFDTHIFKTPPLENPGYASASNKISHNHLDLDFFKWDGVWNTF